MNSRPLILCSLLMLGTAAKAGDGLVLPDERTLWPRWQTRLDATLRHPTHGLGLDAARTLQQFQIMNDYFPQRFSLADSSSWRGGLRATGGLIFGSRRLAGTDLTGASRVLVHVEDSRLGGDPAASSGIVSPYFGIGYTGLSRTSGWGFSADVGVLLDGIGSANGRGLRSTPATGLDDKVRAIRMTPTLQLGVNYAF